MDIPISLEEGQKLAVEALEQAENRRQDEREREAAWFADYAMSSSPFAGVTPMKIIIEIDCSVEGDCWQDKYENELIEKIQLPGVVVCGDEGKGCGVIFDTTTWTFQPPETSP